MTDFKPRIGGADKLVRNIIFILKDELILKFLLRQTEQIDAEKHYLILAIKIIIFLFVFI